MPNKYMFFLKRGGTDTPVIVTEFDRGGTDTHWGQIHQLNYDRIWLHWWGQIHQFNCDRI